MAMKSESFISGGAAYTELTDGAAEEVRAPARVSIRYLANVAA
jgi:hypothetical protein